MVRDREEEAGISPHHSQSGPVGTKGVVVSINTEVPEIPNARFNTEVMYSRYVILSLSPLTWCG